MKPENPTQLHQRVIPYLSRVQEVCIRHQVEKLAVFGSMLTEKENPADIDLLVTFHEMEPVQYAHEYFGLESDLEKIFNLPIDLVEEHAIRNPVFREIVAESSIELYAST
ncbi:MAG: nucleotidyltransferase domain-containing protein [Methanospirillum sp.]|uniref:nucleotidyltransferase family protein n=1 Tax=Methanospirillum sp. TaxID=45200 RepID=UPI00236F6CCD|nr:nucleotidyltransferase domain-containing protein [Methanospirillum sp.]MDD1728607.1 nucleotidyltransferase domain-containing protein [Methanospirillum sp.]